MTERMIRRYILVDEYGIEDDDNEYADVDEAMDAARDQGYSVIVREFISVRAYPVYTAPTTGAARWPALTTHERAAILTGRANLVDADGQPVREVDLAGEYYRTNHGETYPNWLEERILTKRINFR